MRVLGHRHAHAQSGSGVFVGLLRAVHHGNLGIANGGELAGLHRGFNAGDVEEQARVLLGGHHVGVMHAVFGVVLVAGGELAVERGGHQVAVAVDTGLPLDVHALGVHACEQAVVLLGVIGCGAALVGQRYVEFLAAEHARRVVDGRVHRVALVGEDAVKALHIGQLGDLVANHVVQADTRQAGVELVVHPGVFAVVNAVLVRRMDVVRVTRGVPQRAIGLGAHDGLGLVGLPPAHHGIGHHAGNAVQLTPGWDTQNAHVTRVPTAPQAVMRVQLAGLDFGAARAAHIGSGRCRHRCRRCRRCRRR